MVLAGLILAGAVLPIQGPPGNDIELFLVPWMAQIQKQGLSSIAGGFSAYAPPYIYLLNMASLLVPSVGITIAVKLLNVPFVVSLALAIGAIVKDATNDRDRAQSATAVMFVMPTLQLNAFAWGQADVIYTSFLAWFVYLAMLRQPAAAAIMFGIALSFKFQAIFLSPLLAYLLLSHQMRVRDALLIPVTYIIMMAPAAFAGRPWAEIFAIFSHQAGTYHELSMNAPNPWWFARFMDYRLGVLIGLAAGAACGLWIALGAYRAKWPILYVAVLCALVMPFVLPKMHSRYTFVADALVVALAFTNSRMWPAAVLVQVGSFVACLSYFFWPMPTAQLGFFPMAAALALILDSNFGPDLANTEETAPNSVRGPDR
ncbi:MAG: hypothetical protein ABI439_14430 [Rhodospirillales bacterium]